MPERQGQWAYTHVFSLNNHYGAEEVTVPFNLVKINTIPILSEFDINGADPSGSRHLTTHPSFTATLASGFGPVSASLNFKTFDLNATDISAGSGISCTRVFLFRASGFDCPTSRIHNMKIWASDLSDFLCPQTVRVIYQTSRVWTSGFQFGVEKLGDKDFHMDSSLPERQNLFRQDGGATIHIANDDNHVSEWIYTAIAASGTVPLGEYGRTRDGPEGFVLRVTYSTDNLDRFKD